MEKSAPILETKDLVKVYNGRRVVNKLSYQVYPSEIIGLLGPNGAGKTTAFYMTVGLIHQDEGSVIFNGKDVSSLPMHERARMGMGYLAQEPSVFRSMSVEDNIMSILETVEPDRKVRDLRLKQLLGELSLESLATKRASTLSGGERRRLEITRALVTNPICLMLDEPFANIDPLAIQDVKNMIKILSKKNISIVITDHNAREIFSVVHRCYLVCDGQAIFSGTSQELVNNEQARSSYLGESFHL